MRVGVVREIKIDEARVAITPAGARELVGEGHEVVVEREAGVGAGYPDDAYDRAGATVVTSAEEVWGTAELVVKVKEPQAGEIAMIRAGQVVFGYLHLAADREMAQSLAATGATCVAYESVRDGRQLPLLIPMSEVAGRIAGLACAYHLGRVSGGRGVLMGGIAGVAPAEVVVIGAGTAGTNAAAQAVGLGASVKLLDRDLLALRIAEERFDGRVSCLYSTTSVLEDLVANADALIGSVLIPGRARRTRRQPPDGGVDGGGQRARRHQHRPGRLHRDQPAHHAQPPDLRRGGRHPLLRDQHAVAVSGDEHVLAHQRHAALRARHRRARHRPRLCRRPAPRGRGQPGERHGDAARRGRADGHRIRRVGHLLPRPGAGRALTSATAAARLGAAAVSNLTPWRRR